MVLGLPAASAASAAMSCLLVCSGQALSLGLSGGLHQRLMLHAGPMLCSASTPWHVQMPLLNVLVQRCAVDMFTVLCI